MTPIDREKRALILEDIHERLGFVRLYAEIAQQFAEAGDCFGVGYALDKFAIYAGSAVNLRRDLDEFMKSPQPTKVAAE